ncbi:phospholipase A1 member A-like [Neocloeon triangulifer]|uniref:phospholipase A1 member A-like n=1 Tax=Neocloeon triangulifer TaxID=2078957 RepID=UPI00286F8855|nr:phospholipase A1 member A-like [Neocloeon triangulifer]
MSFERRAASDLAGHRGLTWLTSVTIILLALLSQQCQSGLIRPILNRPTSTLIGPDGIKLEISAGPCLLHLSESCSNAKVKFYFVRDLEAEEFYLLDSTNPASLDESGFDPSRPLKLLIHGYNGTLNNKPINTIARAYIEDGAAVNLVMLDWSAYTNIPCYPTAVINAWQAGRCTAKTLQEIAAWTGSPRQFFSELHIVGFSLGAHVAGFTGSYVKPNRISRITGLDPALPFFKSLNRAWKLDPSDARFVDVIHTNAGQLGKLGNVGHADFYVNGGSTQPACNNSDRPAVCSHLLAPTYFAESILESARGFFGYPCQSFLYYAAGWCDEKTAKKDSIVMGEYCPQGARGVFVVNTGKEAPYSLGIDLLEDEEEISDMEKTGLLLTTTIEPEDYLNGI